MNVSINPDHMQKSKNMSPNQLMNHLKNKGGSTHTAILAYLSKLSSFQHRTVLLVIMTKWQVPGQQQQYNRDLLLVEVRTQVKD
jgi:hypothetical protein